MECSELAAGLTAFLDGSLGAEEEAAALEHLASCSECEAVLAGTRSIVALATQYAKIDLTGDERALVLSRIISATGEH